jgi:hypothetical protein
MVEPLRDIWWISFGAGAPVVTLLDCIGSCCRSFDRSLLITLYVSETGLGCVAGIAIGKRFSRSALFFRRTAWRRFDTNWMFCEPGSRFMTCTVDRIDSADVNY